MPLSQPRSLPTALTGLKDDTMLQGAALIHTSAPTILMVLRLAVLYFGMPTTYYKFEDEAQ
jgi:hypothetical protein